MKLIPMPHAGNLLDANPAQAFARKPEYPLEFLYSNHESYLALSDLVGGMTVIAPMPARDVKRQVLKHALRLLSSDGSQSEPARESMDPGAAGTLV